MHERRMTARWVLGASLLGLACGSTDGSSSPVGGAGAGAGGTSSSAGTSSGGPGTSGTASSAGTTSSGGLHSGGTEPAGGGQGGSSLGGSTDQGGGGSATAGAGGGSDCGELVSTAPSLTEVQRASELPAPQGGSVTDGTYVLTARNVYPPSTASSAQHSATLKLASERYELVRSGDLRETGTFSTMAVVLKLSATCPAVQSRSTPYTATASTLTLFTVSEDLEEVFTKQ